MSSSSSSRRSDKRKSQDLVPESPLSDRSPRIREPMSKKKSSSAALNDRLSPKTPLPLPNSSEAPKHPRRYSTEKVTDFRMEEVHRPTDRVVHVDLEEIEGNVRGGTPNSSLSLPANGALLLNDSQVSHCSPGDPRTSTPKKSSRKSRRAPESLYKKVLMKSASRTAIPSAVNRVVDSSMDDYCSAQESMSTSMGSSMSPIRIEGDGYRSANSTQRALFSQQGAAPLARRHSRSASRIRRSPAPAPTMCQLVTPLAVNTSQEVNAVSVTGQILVISQTLVRSAHASTDTRKLMNHLAGKQPLISNEMSQVDIDHDNEHTKHEVFVGSDAILIQRISTIHRGRDRNSFETDDRRTYRFICQGDLLPEDRRDKQSKPRHLTIVAESATVKDCEEIEKTERVMLIFDAAEKPSRVLAPMPTETSLTHANNDLTSKPSALKDSPVSFEEHVRVSDHSHINIVRKARVNSCPRLWDEPLTELKEQRVYKQQLADASDCEPVRITRSHSMSRQPIRDRSVSASRRATPSRVERGRTPGRASRNSTMLRPLTFSPLSYERRPLPNQQLPPDCTPTPSDLLTCISPLKDEPARRETSRRRIFNIDDTVNDSASLPSRTTESDRSSPDPKTLMQRTLRVSPSPSPAAAEITTTIGPFHTARSVSRSPAKRLPLTPRSSQKKTPRTPSKATPVITTDDEQPLRSVMRTPSPARQQRRPLTPLRTARVQSPRTPTRPAVIVDEDTSAGSSQSPTQNRTPTTVSPRRSRLTTAVYQSPAASTSGRRPSRDSSMDDWERMLDTTQPISPVAAAIARRIPDDFLPAAAPTSDSRLARVSKPFRSLRQSHETRPRPSTARPLGPAKSCTNLDSAGRLAQPVRQHAQLPTPPRRAFSEHSVFHPTAAPLAAPANSVTAIAPPLARQQPAAAPAAVPVPRIPRTTRPASSSSGPVALSASGSATRQRPTAPSASATPAMKYAEFSVPHTVVGTQRTGGPTQRNVTLVSNPEDYDEGEILKKKLTLECKINGHLWNLSVTFALKADRADLIRFAPKRVRIDDQTLWEETENWSQTSLTPVTGPRTLARGSTSYDQVLLQPVQPLPTSSTVSTQTPPYVPETTVRVAPKNIATASTASSGSRSKSTDKSQKGASKRSSSSNSKSGEKKKLNNTPFV